MREYVSLNTCQAQSVYSYLLPSDAYSPSYHLCPLFSTSMNLELAKWDSKVEEPGGKSETKPDDSIVSHFGNQSKALQSWEKGNF